MQKSDISRTAHLGWLPHISKESLVARIDSLEQQLRSTQDALHSAVSISQEASIQRTGSTPVLTQQVTGSNDVGEALSRVSASLDTQDKFAVAPTVATAEKSSSGLEGMPAGSTVFVTFVNGDEKYREMMINWALHLQAIQVWHVVVAFDDKAASTCAEQGIPFIRYSFTSLFLSLSIFVLMCPYLCCAVSE